MILEERIKEILEEYDFDYTEKLKTIYTTCPSCDRSDKFSVLKENGSCICYHGSCDFGRQWFEDWVVKVSGMSRKEAKEKIIGPKKRNYSTLNLRFDEPVKQPETIDIIEFPEPGFLKLNDPDAKDGLSYILNRGISEDLAMYYNIHYSPWFRRVILPIFMHGECYGWQGRAIDKVDDKERMRNNVGFRKDSVIMFHDNMYNNKNCMLFEGPFDALKFHSFGGIICSMGKIISNKQVEMINKSPVDTVYLGLDADAATESRQLTKRIEKKIKILTVPDTCKDRCKKLNKKPDFGECTFIEAKQAFESAKDYSEGYIFLHFK